MIDDDNNKQIILVDKNDRQIGVGSKLMVHQHGWLHRAYSVFIFRKTNGILELLMQRRAFHKYHCGGLWSNTCCSHPNSDTNVLDQVSHRLKEEMGFTTEIKKVGVFYYHAYLPNGLIEHEIDHLFVGFKDIPEINPCKDEVAEIKWEAIQTLILDIDTTPVKYTPWLKRALLKVLEQINY